MLFIFSSRRIGGRQCTEHAHLHFDTRSLTPCSPSIEADIKAGTTVVIDRYYYSGCVYSAAKGNPSLDLNWARHPEEGLPRPDLCLFLDVSPQEAASRGGFGEEKYENAAMQTRVRELFRVLQSSVEGGDFNVIDADQSMDRVEETILKCVKEVMQKVDTMQSPLRRVGPW